MTQTFTAGQTLPASSVNQDLAFPTGLVVPYAGASAPAQGAAADPLPWLLCDGSEYSETVYSVLFAAISTAFNTGEETAGFFRVPDLRGRVPAGADNMGGSAASRLTSGASGVDGATLGAAGGAQTHTLTTAEMPAHRHDVQENSSNSSLIGGHYGGGSSAQSSIAGYGGGAIYVRNTGGGGAHKNVQPTVVLNYLIKT